MYIKKLLNTAVVANNVSRRDFIKVSSLAGLGFMVGCGKSAEHAPEAHAKVAGSSQDAFEFNAFVKVTTDNKVTVVVKHLDKGQGVTTGLPTIVAEEMDAAWEQMDWEFAPADASRYNNLFWGTAQGTGGSSSIANSWMQLRTAGATARAMLVNAAAEQWQVPAAEIEVKQGVLSHSSGKSGGFGEFAAAAANHKPSGEPRLKDPGQFTMVGASLPRKDSPAKTTGRAVYTIDMQLPDMLVAVVAHPPRFGATVKTLDDAAAKAKPGVVEVVSTARGVAVLATGYWQAIQGRQALNIEWDDTSAEVRSSNALRQYFKELASQPGEMLRNDGDLQQALDTAEQVIEAEFEFPFLAHATMEPLNCVVQLRADECEIWTGSQAQTLDQHAAAAITGLSVEQIKINTLFAGGSFGRRAVPDSDYVKEAVLIAKAMAHTGPVKLQWSREDDMQGGRYRPMAYHKLRATLKDGQITGWHDHVVSQSLLRGSAFEAFIEGPIDPSVTEGAHNVPYAIPSVQIEAQEAVSGVPVLWWRSVGHTFNAFAVEVFLDQLAAQLDKDPVQLRRELLAKHPRHLGVLERVVEASGWGKPLAPNRGRGVAVHESFNSYVAEVAEVTVADDGSYSVDRVVCAVDCGIAVNPDVIRAQMEGGIGFGLGAIMREAITLTEGKVDQQNFMNYLPLRIDEMPDIEVHIMASGEAPTGVGEPGVPPIGPAVANALRAVTGNPIHALPIGNKVQV